MHVEIDKSILSPEGYDLLSSLFAKGWVAGHLYLAGGTGLALQIGHRTSHHIGLFTASPADHLPSAVQRGLEQEPGRITLRERGQVDFERADTRVSVVAYPFALTQALVASSGIRMAVPAEIALMKAYSLGRRIAARDYIDLYFLLRQRHATLEQIRRDGQAKFQLGGEAVFSYTAFLRLLVDSSDVEDWEEALSLVRQPGLTRAAIEDYFVELVREESRLA